MKTLLITSTIVAGLSSTAFAGCYGDSSYRVCTDPNNGNRYTTMDLGGGMRSTHGSAENGNTWSSTTTDLGSGITSTRGIDAQGNDWHETTIDLGNGMRSYSGTDSDGNSFSGMDAE